MGAIRTLVTKLVLDADAALKGLKAYNKAWSTVASGVEATATRIERAAARASASLASVAAGAGQVAAGAGSGSRGPAAPRSGAAPKAAGIDKAVRAAGISEAARAGLAAGSQAINATTAALGPLASKADVAKAKIADLTAQLERNRKEQADLKRQTIETGDAEGKLAARSAGLAAANKDVAISLTQARRGLSEVRGGLIDNIKAAADLSNRFVVLKVAAGNMLSSGIQALGRGTVSALEGAASSAMKFESGMAGVAKVVDGLKGPSGEITDKYREMEGSILDLSKTIAGPGAEGFAKIYAAAGEAGIADDELARFAESAAKVSVAFDITADEAGGSMAKLRTGLGMTQDEVESLAGTMNYLSSGGGGVKGMAVSAAQAMEVALKVGGVGKAANVSAQEVTGLGSAMIAAGAESDVAATASKNYILALASGETATKRQRAAFAELGMSAEDVARKFTGSAAERLAVQKELLTNIDKLDKDAKVAALSNLFGKESLGAISGITGNIDLFTKSMTMATDATAAAASVQAEYETRSKTSENAVALLKANIEALAIKFGQALLPYINKIVAFLTSKEGQEWGAKAVEKAVTVVTGLADALGVVGGILSGLIETFGAAGIAIAAVGLAASSLAGPFGIAAAAGLAAGAAIVGAFHDAESAMDKMVAKAQDIRHAEHEAEMKEANESLAADQAGQDAHTKNRARAEELAKKYEDAELARMGKNASEADKLAAFRKSRQLASAVEGNSRLLGGGTEEDRLAALEKYVTEKTAGPAAASAPAAKRGGRGGGRGGGHGGDHGHKATKMDKALATLDPSLSGILTRGGEEDEGGDFKVADNVLDRAVFGRATKGRGGEGAASIGPGPNITNDNRVTNITTNVNQVFPAERGMEGRVAAAGRAGGERAAMAVNSTAKQAVNAGGTIR